MTIKELKDRIDKLVAEGYGDYKVVVDCRDSGGDYFEVDDDVRLWRNDLEDYFSL